MRLKFEFSPLFNVARATSHFDVVKRSGFTPPPRADIRRFSLRSRRRMAFAADCLAFRPQVLGLLSFGKTFPNDGKIVKGFLNAWLTTNREIIGRYFWFLEFQKRGAPHFHIATERALTETERRKLARSWSRILSDGLELSPREAAEVFSFHNRTENFQTLRGDFARYAAKYGEKLEQKTVPDGFLSVGRFWACSRSAFSVIVLNCDFSRWPEIIGEVRRLARLSVEAEQGDAPCLIIHNSSAIYAQSPHFDEYRNFYFLGHLARWLFSSLVSPPN